MLNVNLVRNILKSKISYPAQHLILRLADAEPVQGWLGADFLSELLPDLGRNKFYQVLGELIERGFLERQAERGPDFRYRQVGYRLGGALTAPAADSPAVDPEKSIVPTVNAVPPPAPTPDPVTPRRGTADRPARRPAPRDPDQLSLMTQAVPSSLLPDGQEPACPAGRPALQTDAEASTRRRVIPATDSLQLGLLWERSAQMAIAIDTKRLQGNPLHDQLLRYIVDRYQHYYQQYRGRIDTTLINRFQGLEEEYRDHAYELIAKLEMLCPRKGKEATGKEVVDFWEFVLKNVSPKGKEFFHFRNLTRLLQKYVEEAHQVAAHAAERERKATGQAPVSAEEQQAERAEQIARHAEFVTGFMRQMYQYRLEDKQPTALEKKALPALVSYLRQCWRHPFPVPLIPESLQGRDGAARRVNTDDLAQTSAFLHQTLQGWVDQGLTLEGLDAFLRKYPYRPGESQSPPERRSDPRASVHLAQRLHQRLAV